MVRSPDTKPDRQAVHTRTGIAWLGIGAAAAVLTVLIVFMLQNTGSVEVSFFWTHGSVPLAIALLITAVGASLLTIMVSLVRLTQLRHRLSRRS